MRFLALFLLLPTLVMAQGLNSGPPGRSSGGKTLASFPLSTSGALIEEDANTVAHVYWNGTALVDTKGNAWTMNGTVPQVSANPFTTTRYGSGPYASGDFYASPDASDILDFAGDFTVCVVFQPPATALFGYLINNLNTTGNVGWELYINNVSDMRMAVGNGTYNSVNTANTVTFGGPNVVCAGRSGANTYAKLNLGTTATSGAYAYAPNTGVNARIGRRVSTNNFMTGTIYEVYATSTPFTEATVTAIQQKVLGHFDGSAPLAVTRATLATYENPAGTVWTVPSGVARITTDGLLVEPARTNYALQSNTVSTGTAATSPWTLSNATVATVADAPMGGTWAELTSTTNLGTLYGNSATFTSATTLVGSLWMSSPGATTDAAFAVRCGAAPTTCTCVRSDGGACTTSLGGAAAGDCNAKIADLTATPVRLSAIVLCPAGVTTAYMSIYPGVRGTSTGTVRFSGAQLEVGTYPTSLIVTTTTATARNADQVSATVPAVPSKWCVAVTAKPEENATWAAITGYRIWSLGTQGAAGAAHWLETGFMTYDQTAASKTLAWTPPTSGETRGVFCNTAGVLSATTTGGTVGGLSGAGTSLANSWQTTMYIGQRSTGTPYFSGYLKNLKICSAKSAKECK